MSDALELRLQGPRLLLRSLRPADADGAYQKWLNDPEITRHLESRFATHSVEAIRDYIAAIAADPSYVFLAICLLGDERHIGNIKLGPIVLPHNHGDIGLIIGEKDCWGKGYASEAIALLTAYAFAVLKLHKLTAGCYHTNPGSARAFQNAGYVIEGTRRSHYWQDGEFVDGILLGKLNPLAQQSS